MNVLPIPKHSGLVNMRYDSFDAALRDARALVPVQAASIETVDSKVLALARNDIVWQEVREFFPDDEGRPARASTSSSSSATEAGGRGAARAGHDGAARRRARHGRRGFTVARGERGACGRIWDDAQEGRRPARQHAGRAAAHPLRRGHGGAARAPRRLHRRVPRARWTAAGWSTACSATSMPASCMSARRST